MFLVRTAFWLAVVVMLLPAPASDQSGLSNVALDQAEALSTGDLIEAARGTIEDLAGLCGRNPGVCETGGAAIDTFKRKARYGALLLYDFFAEPGEASGMSDDGGHTLRPRDLEPGWTVPTQGERRV